MSKTKNFKPLLDILAGIAIGVVITAVAITRYPLPTRIASLISIKPSPSPIAITSPSPLPQLSERALKVAAWGVTSASDSGKKAAKDKRGDVNMSDTDLIRMYAMEVDADPVLLAEKEAKMQNWLAEKNRPVVNYDAPNVNVEAPDYPKTCYTMPLGNSSYTTCK